MKQIGEMKEMHKKNKLKAILSIAVVLAMVLPGSAVFANFGTTNFETTMDKNIEDAPSTNDLSSSNDLVNIISDAKPNSMINVPVAIPTYSEDYADRETYDETSESEFESVSVDWWPMFQHDAQHTGYSSGSAPDTNHVRWRKDGIGGSSPAVVDDKIYFGSYHSSDDDNFYCLNASDGSVIWTYPTGGMYSDSVPAVVDGKVYIGSHDRENFYCLNAMNGSLIWKYTDITRRVTSSPSVADGKVYFGSWDHNVYCIDASNGSLIWKYPTGDRVYSSPAIADGKVFIGSGGSYDGNFYCLNAHNGSPIWSCAITGQYTSPAVADGKVYLGHQDSRTIYCLNVSDGSIIWSCVTIGHFTSPAVADGKVYVGIDTSYENLYCLDAQTGVKIWTYSTGYRIERESSPSVADGKVFVGSSDEYVHCVDIQTGSLIWKYATNDWVYSSPAVADGMLFVGTGRNKRISICCFGPNRPPNEPCNPNPEDDAVDVDINIDINWTGGDPDTEDDVTYDIYFDTATPPSKIASTQQIFYDLGSLGYETEYFWKIIARDNSNVSTEGPIWSFTTGIETSQPPYHPTIPVPCDGDMGVNINADLRWVGGDPNPADTITYDVYFGTTIPPSKIVSNQSVTVYSPGTMDNETAYYWKIISWDNHGASTESPIWSFTTEKKPGVDWWPMYQHDLNRTGNSSSLMPNSGVILWCILRPFGRPIIFDDKLYINSGSSGYNGFCCLDPSDSSLIWKFDTNIVNAVITDGKVFGSIDNNFCCFDASNGSLIWEYPMVTSSSPPAVADGKVFIGVGNRMYCLDASDGSLIWKYSTRGDVPSSPAVADGRVFVSSYDGSLYCLNASNGLLIWKYTALDRIWISPVVVGDRVLFASERYGDWYKILYCLNASDGSLIWTHDSDSSACRKEFAVANGKVFFHSIRQMKMWIDAIDIQTGSVIWSRIIAVWSHIVAADGKVFVGGGRGLICLDESDGSTVWDYDIGEAAYALAVADGKIFATSRKGLFCFGSFQGHDVGATDIDSPVSDLAGAFTPEVTVKNFGIYDEVDVPVNMLITKMFEPYIDEQFFKLFPPSGWTVDEAGEWKQNNDDTAGGEPPEARLYYKDIQGDYTYLQSFSVDTTDSIEMILEFKSIISCYKGGSNCNVLMRSDSSESWSDITPWSNPITKSAPSQNYIIDVSLFIGTGTQIRFEFVGDNEGIMYWSLDDIIFYRRSVSSEYNETITVDLDAGQDMDVVLPEWTPEDLQYGISGLIEYNVIVCTQMTIDEFLGNDQTDELITLEYLHDVGVDEITEPSGPPDLFFDEAWIHFDDGLNTGIGLVPSGGTFEAAIRITPDELGEYDHWAITNVKFFHYVRQGRETHYGNIKIYVEGSEIEPGDLISITPYTVTGEGWHEILLLNPVVIDSDEDVWVSVEVTHVAGEYPIGVDFGPAVDGKGDWFGYEERWNELQFYGLDFNWNIWAKVEEVTGWPPGTYPVEAVVKNHGSFNESNFNVNATIYKRTMAGDKLFWEDDATVASLIPGEETVVVFDDVTFGDKDVGVFRLEIATELVDDDNVRNDWNIKRFIMGILDVVPPVITLDKQRIGLRTKFTASVTDPLPSSGINRVEFYLDGDLEETFVEDANVTEGVYKWNYTGLENLTVMVIVYDNAGNSATNKSSTPYSQSSISSQITVEGGLILFGGSSNGNISIIRLKYSFTGEI